MKLLHGQPTTTQSLTQNTVMKPKNISYYDIIICLIMGTYLVDFDMLDAVSYIK